MKILKLKVYTHFFYSKKTLISKKNSNIASRVKNKNNRLI